MAEPPELRLCRGGIVHLVFGRHRWPVSAIILAVICWAPGFIVNDWPNHVRFLIAMPLLILAEGPIEDRMSRAARYLMSVKVAREADVKMHAGVIRRLNRVECNAWLELGLFALLIGISFFRDQGATGSSAGWAGLWQKHVALPVFQLVMFRWILRAGLWSYFLFSVARTELVVAPHHPDGMGGFGFLPWVHRAFAVVVLAISSVLAAMLYQEGLSTQELTKALQQQGLLLFVVNVVIFLGPLLAFTPPLIRARKENVLKLSYFSEYCARFYQNAWIGRSEGELDRLKPFDTENPSFMIDLISSQDHARRMSVYLVNKSSLIAFGAASLLPMGPVFLSKFGWEQLLKLLLKLFV